MFTRRPFGRTTPRDWFRDELRNVLRDATRTGGRQGRRARPRSAGVFPPVNIYDDGEGFRVRAELPGVDKEDLELNLKGDQLLIRGERTIEPAEEADYHRRERESTSFSRAVELPEPVDGDGIRATLELGVLDVYAPRAAEAKPRTIEIEG
ncbi:MAG: Hsp20/alpha crystallin family protein [Bradymonadaceae bacterium]